MYPKQTGTVAQRCFVPVAHAIRVSVTTAVDFVSGVEVAVAIRHIVKRRCALLREHDLRQAHAQVPKARANIVRANGWDVVESEIADQGVRSALIGNKVMNETHSSVALTVPLVHEGPSSRLELAKHHFRAVSS